MQGIKKLLGTLPINFTMKRLNFGKRYLYQVLCWRPWLLWWI